MTLNFTFHGHIKGRLSAHKQLVSNKYLFFLYFLHFGDENKDRFWESAVFSIKQHKFLVINIFIERHFFTTEIKFISTKSRAKACCKYKHYLELVIVLNRRTMETVPAWCHGHTRAYRIFNVQKLMQFLEFVLRQDNVIVNYIYKFKLCHGKIQYNSFIFERKSLLYS